MACFASEERFALKIREATGATGFSSAGVFQPALWG